MQLTNWMRATGVVRCIQEAQTQFPEVEVQHRRLCTSCGEARVMKIIQEAS